MAHSLAYQPSDHSFELRAGTFLNRPVVDRLMEHYLYDYSEFDGCDLDEHGLYRFDDLDYYWTNKDREVLMLRIVGKWGGLVLISTETLLEGNDRSIDNLVIMRKYRRWGLGAMVARAIFNRTPAKWEQCVLDGNAPATPPWRRTIADYTCGASCEEDMDSDDWHGSVFSRDSRSAWLHQRIVIIRR